MKKALITGVGGQDGSFLAEYLVGLGYEVWGTTRGHENAYDNLIEAHGNDSTLLEHLHIIRMDLRDELSVAAAIRKSNPDEIYNLGGQVFVPVSWQYPEATIDVNVNGLVRILKSVEKYNPKIRVYQASSSEMFGNVQVTGMMLTERDRMHPVSPYGTSKLAAHEVARVFREAGLYVCCGILFNHESWRRGVEMVTRKITQHIARWHAGSVLPLKLGNPNARRDWGFAGDYIKAMHAMLQQPKADDYVIGTGESHSVQEFLDSAMEAAGLTAGPVEWNAPMDVRANELHCLTADYSKARAILGWAPETSFMQLVTGMVEKDIARVYQENKVLA